MEPTKEMQEMTKEELIANIVKCDERGRSFETHLRMVQELQCVPEEDIQKGIELMKQLAMARVAMEKLLAVKYGILHLLRN